MHLHYTAIFGGVFSEVLHEIWRIFPRSFDIVVISDVPTSNILYKTNEKAVSFLSTTSSTSRDISWVPSFSQPHGVFARKHWKVCCSLLQWSDVHTWIWCRTCTVRFFRSLLILFSSFQLIWVCKMKVLWKVASSRAEDLKPVFFILSQVQREEFHSDKAISCKSYVQLLIQDVYSISSKTCQVLAFCRLFSGVVRIFC